MPNLFVALFAVPAAALVALYLQEPRQRRLVWFAVCIGAAALLRPSDALYLGAALGIVGLVTPHAMWRNRIAIAVASAAGFLAGATLWVIEAYLGYGGVLKRYHDFVAEQGGGGLHFSIPAALQGRHHNSACTRKATRQRPDLPE